MLNKEEIENAWHEKADQLLPEFNFKKTAHGWKSTSGQKATGEAGQPGKVYYYANTPYGLKDFTRGFITLIEYIQDREKIASYGEALRYMADAAGITYDSFKSEEDRQHYEQYNKRARILEDVNTFFIEALSEKENTHAQSAEAMRLRYYLETKRGYTAADIRLPGQDVNDEAPRMELGYFPNYEALRDHLTEKGYSGEAITEIAATIPAGAGTTNKLTIPYRDTTGRIIGFAFRQTAEEAKAKYLFSTGLKKADILFNLRRLRGSKDVVIVESQLDAMLATARGIENVVAIGGNNLSDRQAAILKKQQPKKITLCLDQDEAGSKGTDAALQVLRDMGAPVYVATLPVGIKDADECIIKKGADTFKKSINEAQRDYHYKQDQLENKYRQREVDGVLLLKDQDEMLREIVAYGAGVHDPIDRSAFTGYFKQLFSGVITDDAIKEATDLLRYDLERERQKKEILNTVNSVNTQIQSGADPKKVLDETQDKLKQIRILRGADLLPAPYTFENFVTDITRRSEALKTGYDSLDKHFRIPTGATTLIAGRTSHGKTAFLFNLTLKMAELYTDKVFYFLSYEETKDRILNKMLNSLINSNLSELLPQYSDLPGNQIILKQYLDHRRSRHTDYKPVEKIETQINKLTDLLNSGRLIITDEKYRVEELQSLILSQAKNKNIGGVFIDYAQRLKTEKEFKDKRLEVDYISKILCDVAIETDAALIIGAQLNRTAAQDHKTANNAKRPRLENLKESGSLEEDANSVLTVYNEYAEKIDDISQSIFDPTRTNLEVQAVKNRDGKRNHKAILLFNQETGNIRQMSIHEEKDYRREQEDKKKTGKKKEEAVEEDQLF